jgi:hypothetical protein
MQQELQELELQQGLRQVLVLVLRSFVFFLLC